MIHRTSEHDLKHWFDKTRRKPLVLRGARQVGKSTLVRQFAKEQKLILNEINLERHLPLNDVFKTLDMKQIIKELEGLLGRNILKSDSLLFLDEVQATPHALAALRYFYEELPELPVIAAGSLLEFALADHSFSMPVGRVEYLHISPISFSEFLECFDPDLEVWRDAAGRFEEIPKTAHQRLLSRLREYLFIGGMPEAIMEYIETGSLFDVQEVHRSIIETYQDDFAKYASRGELVRLQRIFGQIPRNIGRKIKYVNLSREERSREIKSAVELLSRAQVCQKVTATHCSGVPLSAEASEDVYKLIFMDVGIANYLCGGRWKDMSNATAQTLINEGPLAEQFVGQHLAYLDRSKPQLHYWLREGRANNAEVDYVITKGMKILPIEVKSGSSGTLKSLQQFALEKGCEQAIRFDLNQSSRMMVDAKTPAQGTPWKRLVSNSFRFHFMPWNPWRSGKGLYLEETASALNCLIENNTATDGGGLFFDHGGYAQDIDSLTNEVDSIGGAGAFLWAGGTLRNGVIEENISTGQYARGGSGILFYDAGGLVDNSVIADNISSTNNGGINFRYSGDTAPSKLGTVNNSIIWPSQTTLWNGTGNQFVDPDQASNVPTGANTNIGANVPADVLNQTTSYFYDLNGNLVKRVYPNCVVETRTFDALNRLLTMKTETFGKSWFKTEYQYDAVGSMRQKLDTRSDSLSGKAFAATTTWVYDNRYRLTQETINVPGQVYYQTKYTWDSADNRLTRKKYRGSLLLETLNYTINNLNQITESINYNGGKTVRYAYDNNGNRTNKTVTVGGSSTSTTYVYDYDNRLTSTSGSIVSAFKYDYRSRRYYRSTPTETNLCVFDGGLCVQEYNVPQASSLPTLATLSTEYLRGPDLGGGVGGMVCSIRDGEKIYSHSNHRGDVIARTDGTGSLTWFAIYEAYGTRPFEWGTNLDRQKANTKDEEAELGLLNEGMRYRDLETGTFLTRDPIRYGDGPNMYCYVHCNPITHFDAWGLFDQDDIDKKQNDLDEKKQLEKEKYDEFKDSFSLQAGKLYNNWKKRQKELEKSQAEIYKMQAQLDKSRWGDTDIPNDYFETMFIDYNGVPKVGIYKNGVRYDKDATKDEIARYLKKDSLGRVVAKSVDEINADFVEPIADTCGAIDEYMTPLMEAEAYIYVAGLSFGYNASAATGGSIGYLANRLIKGEKPTLAGLAGAAGAGIMTAGQNVVGPGEMLRSAGGGFFSGFADLAEKAEEEE